MVTRPRGVKWSCLTNRNTLAVYNVDYASAALQAASHTQNQNPSAVLKSPIQVSLLHFRRGWRPSAGTRHSHMWKGAVLPTARAPSWLESCYCSEMYLEGSHVDQQACCRHSEGPWLTGAWVYMCVCVGGGSSPVPEMSLDFPWQGCCVSVKTDWSSICQNQNQEKKKTYPSCNPLPLSVVKRHTMWVKGVQITEGCIWIKFKKAPKFRSGLEKFGNHFSIEKELVHKGGKKSIRATHQQKSV